MSLIGDLPLRLIHDLVIKSRRTHFRVGVPPVDGFLVDVTIPAIEQRFADHRWEDGRIPSFYYQGEDCNLRRPAGLIDGLWMQDHVRWFETADGRVWGICHREPSPLPHPKAHYHERGFSWTHGETALGEQLDAIGWSWELVSRSQVDLTSRA